MYTPTNFTVRQTLGGKQAEMRMVKWTYAFYAVLLFWYPAYKLASWLFF